MEDVQLVEGDAVFRDAIVAALRDGRYQPAANRGESLSYPIALEFSFSLADDRQGAPVASSRYPIIGMWKPGAALPSSGQREVIVLPRV